MMRPAGERAHRSRVNGRRTPALRHHGGLGRAARGPRLLVVDLAVLVAVLLAAALGALVALLARGVLGSGSLRGRRAGDHPSSALPGAPDVPDAVAEVLALVGGPAVVLDVADEVVRASPAAHAMGLIRGSGLAHPETLALVRAARRDGATHESRLLLRRGRTPDARPSVLSARVAPLGTLHVLLLATDHTESVRVEEVRRDFIVNVSHELKTPVGALGLLSEAIESAADDPVAVRRFASRANREARRLDELVRDIVELSKVQVDDPVVGASRVDLTGVLEEAVDRCRLVAEDRGVVLDLTVDPDEVAAAQVVGDADQLASAVTNLVDNAVRYSDPGTRVAIGLQREGASVEVLVTDQGPGIPEAEQERVFERFYRVDPARSRATGGTGLGLAIVKHVAAGHGGEVSLWSQVGQGSTFGIRLPDRAGVRETAGLVVAADRDRGDAADGERVGASP